MDLVPKRRDLGEFELIAECLAPLAQAEPGALGLLDDAAVLDIPADMRLVVAADMAVEGVHYNDDDPPQLIARKLLRYNLSDLAAMGAEPRAYLLTLAKPHSRSSDWVAGLAEGLAVDQEEFAITLVGGDTTATAGPACLSITVLGLVKEGCELRRSGARPGDALFVSGTIGDGALGLLALRGKLEGLDAAELAWLVGRYQLPEPRLALGRALAGVASATIDISDGLVADLEHICSASSVGAAIEVQNVPLSPSGARAISGDEGLRATALTGGDDYELLFSVPPGAVGSLEAIEQSTGISVSRIGSVQSGSTVEVTGHDGKSLDIEESGFRHF